MIGHRSSVLVVTLGIGQLIAACGDSAGPRGGGAAGSTSGAGQSAMAGSAGASGAGSGGAAGSAGAGGGASGGGSGGAAGSGGAGGSVMEPMIPGGPDEPIPADPGEQPFIHPLFTDHMVLQRDAHTPVWGWSKPGDVVTVKIAGETYMATADQYGRWLVRIGPFAADGMARELEISGPQSKTFTDVKFGDVWLCSGQSNMEFTVDGVINRDAELAAAANPDIRLFHVERVNLGQPRQTFGKPGSGPWTAVDGTSVRYFSAVCYFMVKKLQSELKVPMGMIGSYWGGTSVEWWTSREKLTTVEDFTHPLEALPPDAVVDPNVTQNTTLYNGMIAPLLPYGLKGIAWYQGENNGGNGWQYSRLMANMIDDWRARFRMGKLPFFQVQLANYRVNGNAPMGPFDAGSSWAVLREAQERVRLADDKGGMAVILDVGNPTDIHPTDKQDVGLRLAASALHVAYGRDNVYEGPTFESFVVQGNKLTVTFDLVGEGLMIGTKDGTNTNPVVENTTGPLVGFALAGADGMWKVADAVIDAGGKTVTVTSPDVAAPVKVRYGWHDNPGCNLYNKAGLMASSFRSDPDYRVSVVDGSGGGVFEAGKSVQVTANPAPDGQHFVKWVGDTAALNDANQSPATVTVPKAYVSIRATYAP